MHCKIQRCDPLCCLLCRAVPTTQLHIAPPVSTKRQQEYINEDILRLLNPDCNRPFASFEDAVDRLLPFHVSPIKLDPKHNLHQMLLGYKIMCLAQMLAAEETEKADFEEAMTVSSGGLLLSRHEAWQQVCLHKSMQYAEQACIPHKTFSLVPEQP